MGTRARGALIAALVVATPLATAGAASSQASGTDRQGSVTGASATNATSVTWINRFDRAKVNAAYKTKIRAYEKRTSGWTGSVSPCQAGTTTSGYRAALTTGMNFARNLNRLDPVSTSSASSTRAQAAALIMEANDSLSHFPPKTWRCWTSTGSAAAGQSNLHLSFLDTTVGSALDGYLTDYGASNTPVGHRRWILYPYLRTVGHGGTQHANAMLVTQGHDRTRRNPAWVTWPSVGYFPKTMEPLGRWSLSSGSDTASFAKATVTVTRAGTKQRVTVVDRGGVGYGKRGVIVFQVGSGTTRLPSGTYTVTVRGITGAAASTYTYKTTLFTPY